MRVILYWILGGKNKKYTALLLALLLLFFSDFNSVWAYDKEVNLLMVDILSNNEKKTVKICRRLLYILVF